MCTRLSIKTGIDGIRGTISALGREIAIDSPMLGDFYLRNILGASARVGGLGHRRVGGG